MKKSLYLMAGILAFAVLAITSPPVAMASDMLIAISLAKADVVGDPGSSGLSEGFRDIMADTDNGFVGVTDTPAPSSLIMIGGVSFGTSGEERGVITL